MSNNDYKKTFDRAQAYPFVKDEMFEKSTVVDVDQKTIKSLHGAIAIQRSVFDQVLEGTDKHLPSFDLILAKGTVLHDRIPVIAIGSNSSPDVMLKKFEGIGGDFAILQASIEDHAVVHGAFLGAAGTIPATLLPDQGSTAHITVAFLTKAQVEKLITTEPNYDAVALASEVQTRGIKSESGGNGPAVPPGSLVYVSPWGALTKDGKTPLILSSIPSTTPHETVSSNQAMDMIVSIVDPAAQSTEEWFNNVSLAVESRLKINDSLRTHALPATIAGVQVKGATIGEQAEAHGYKKPSIEYLGSISP